MDQLLFESHPSPMLIYDLDSLRILKVNRAFERKYKYETEEIRDEKLTIKDIHPKEDIPRLEETLRNINESGINDSGVHRHIAQNGDIFYIKIASQPAPFEEFNARMVACYDITEQIKAERKSADAYEELQHLLANSPLASIKWDHNLCISEWSTQATEISGYTAEEMIGQNMFTVDVFDRSEFDKISRKIESVVNGSRDQNQFETTIICNDGRRAYIRIYASALRSSGGSLQSLLTLVEDVTEQKKSQIRYQRLFENANDSIFIMKEDVFVDCNKKALALFKAPKREIIGRTPYYFSPAKQPNGQPSKWQARERISKALHNGSYIFDWQHKDTEGRLIDTEVSLNLVNFPDCKYVQAIVRNVSEKKSMEAKLKKSEELFRNLFLKSPAALVMVDAEDCIQVVNESFEKMFGYHLSEIRGKNIDELIVPEKERDLAPKMVNETYVVDDFQIEGIRITKSGKKKHMIIAGMPVYMNNEPVAGFGMYIDIGDRKKSERELKKSLREKRVLLEEIHHRVKNNLAVISGFVQLQAFETEDENIKKVLNDTQLRIKSIALVHEMLYNSESFSNISLNCYISQLLDGIDNILSFDAEHITLNIDADEVNININQAIPCAMLINELLTNAYKHAFEGREEGNITIILKKNGNRVRLKVADDGVGRPENFQSEEASSLGLNLIKTLLRQLRANFEYYNNDGTVFECSFELEDADSGENAV